MAIYSYGQRAPSPSPTKQEVHIVMAIYSYGRSYSPARGAPSPSPTKQEAAERARVCTRALSLAHSQTRARDSSRCDGHGVRTFCTRRWKAASSGMRRRAIATQATTVQAITTSAVAIGRNYAGHTYVGHDYIGRCYVGSGEILASATMPRL